MSGVHADIEFDNARIALVAGNRRAVPLLEDALHALRNGSLDVADEFVDRAVRLLVSARTEHDGHMARGKALLSDLTTPTQ